MDLMLYALTGGGTTTSNISTMLTAVTDIVEEAVGWVGQWGGKVVETPILLMFAVVPLAGFGIGALRRLLSVN